MSLCQVGIGMITASVVVAMLSTQGKKQFVAALTPEQLATYREIARSRLLIYVVSLAVGGGIGWVATQGMGGGWHALCAGAGIAALVTYFTYRLWPKKKWMLDYLGGNQALGIDSYTQTRLWLEMYKTMSWNFHAGFLVGLAGYEMFLRGACSAAQGRQQR